MATTGTAAGVRLDSLTGLRFLAAFMVFAFHSLHYGEQAVGDALFLAGAAGVSFFFIVSGVVMSWTARPGDTAWLFYRRRFARVYPAYAVAWALSLGILAAQGRTPSLVDLAPLTLGQAWWPAESVFWATNAVFWSLSCEAFFYLVFPLAHRTLERLSDRGLWCGVVAVVVLVVGTATALQPWDWATTTYWLGAVFPVSRLAEFVLGMLLGMLLRRGVRVAVPLWPAAGLALLAFLVAGQVPGAFQLVAVTLVPFAVLIWAAASADLAGTASVFRSRPLVLLGTWSYAFYLVHTQAMTGWFEALQRLGIVDKDTVSGPALLAAVAGALVCGLVGAFLLHRGVEVPMERRLRPRRAGPNSLLDEVPMKPTQPAGRAADLG